MADASPDPAAGTTRGEAGVPVVDLTALVRNLYEDADRCRAEARAADALARSARRRADGLEALAAVLAGGG